MRMPWKLLPVETTEKCHKCGARAVMIEDAMWKEEKCYGLRLRLCRTHYEEEIRSADDPITNIFNALLGILKRKGA